MPKLPTLLRHSIVSDALLADMCAVCGEDFAVSYLSGATAIGGILLPWTQTGWLRLLGSSAAMGVIRNHGLKLEKPAPFGSPNHPASLRTAAE